MPHLLWHQRDKKAEKLVQYARRVWGLSGDGEPVIREALDRLIAFFNRLGMPTKLTDYEIDPDEAAEKVRERFEARGTLLGEHEDITPDEVMEILQMSR